MIRVVQCEELSQDFLRSLRALSQSDDQGIHILLNDQQLIGAPMQDKKELHILIIFLQHHLTVRREATLWRVLAHHDRDDLFEEMALSTNHENVVLLDSELAPIFLKAIKASVKDNPVESF